MTKSYIVSIEVMQHQCPTIYNSYSQCINLIYKAISPNAVVSAPIIKTTMQSSPQVYELEVFTGRPKTDNPRPNPGPVRFRSTFNFSLRSHSVGSLIPGLSVIMINIRHVDSSHCALGSSRRESLFL